MHEKMISSCVNCNNSLSGSYCSNCGQSAKTGRVNFHYLIHEIQHSLLHIDKGIFYTIKELILRPGNMIQDYLAGKRVNYFKPFAFVILLSTVYSLVVHFLKFNPEGEIASSLSTDVSHQDSEKVIEFVYSHYSMVLLAFIPFSAFSSFIFFRKSKYNYWEHLIIYSYITGVQVLISFVFFFMSYSIQLVWISFLNTGFMYIYNIVVLTQLFNENSIIKTSLKAAVSVAVSVLFSIIAMTIGIIAFGLIGS